MNQTTITFIKIGSIMMAITIAIGAFGAHALKDVLNPNMTKIYHTGVQYQFYHSLGLFVVAFIAQFNANPKVKIAGYIMLFSIFLFSGSLYALSLSGIKMIGIITPFGGVGFIISWIMLFFIAKRVPN